MRDCKSVPRDLVLSCCVFLSYRDALKPKCYRLFPVKDVEGFGPSWPSTMGSLGLVSMSRTLRSFRWFKCFEHRCNYNLAVADRKHFDPVCFLSGYENSVEAFERRLKSKVTPNEWHTSMKFGVMAPLQFLWGVHVPRG